MSTKHANELTNLVCEAIHAVEPGPYVDVVGHNGSSLPSGGEGVLNVAVNSSHAFSAWKLPNGTWAGFKNNIPGAKSFSAGLSVPSNGNIPGGPWRPAGPNLACDGDCGGKGLGWGPENPVAMLAIAKKHYYAVYDALHVSGDHIGIAWSPDGTYVAHTTMILFWQLLCT